RGSHEDGGTSRPVPYRTPVRFGALEAEGVTRMTRGSWTYRSAGNMHSRSVRENALFVAGVDAESTELLPQRLARDTEQLGDASLVPIGLAERAQEVLALELALGGLERLQRRRGRVAGGRLGAERGAAADLLRKVLEVDVGTARQDEGVADGVLELADVAREAVVRQGGPGARRDDRRRAVVGRQLPAEEFGQ